MFGVVSCGLNRPAARNLAASVAALSVFVSCTVPPAIADETSGKTSDPAFAEFVDEHRAEIAVGLIEIVRKVQARIDQFRFDGVPLATQLDFGLGFLNDPPVITLNVSADPGSRTTDSAILPCDQILNLIRYLIADGNSAYYAQQIKDHQLQLQRVDPTISRASCENLMLGLSIALKRDEFHALENTNTRKNCSNDVSIEAGIGSSSTDVARCSAAFIERE